MKKPKTKGFRLTESLERRIESELQITAQKFSAFVTKAINYYLKRKDKTNI